MKPAGRIDTIDFFAPERAALLDLLRSLSDAEWRAPTVCAGWSVKDLAAHILADDLGGVSRGRDGYTASWFEGPWEELLAYINAQNEAWVDAMRRLSPQLLIELLAFSGERAIAQFRTLGLDAIGHPVDWVSPDPAPVWLDVAREYTERWAHQQQIRDAVDAARGDTSASGLKDRRMMHPVLDAYARALPLTFAAIDAPDGTHVMLRISGDAGSAWSLLRRNGAWSLYEGVDAPPDAVATLDQDTAWRLFTKAITPADARPRAHLEGDDALASRVLETVSVIA